MAQTLIADLRHYLDEDGDLTAEIGPAWSTAAQLTSIVGWVTSRTESIEVLTNVHCRRRPNRRPCEGEILAMMNEEEGYIEWACPECHDGGLIYGWEDSFWDRGKRVTHPVPLFGDAEPESDAQFEAMDLIAEAWELRSEKDRRELAERALALDPHCSDAYLIFADSCASGSAERLAHLERAVRVAADALGPEPFREDIGQFWGLVETRPYMQARLELADEMAHRGHMDQAVRHCRELLELNPNDNQGVRYLLLLYLTQLEDFPAADALLQEYSHDFSAPFSYGLALFRYRSRGPGGKADTLLKEALEWNPHVPDYLLGKKRAKGPAPPMIVIRSEDEALAYALDWKAFWRTTPGALKWLREVSGAGLRRVK